MAGRPAGSNTVSTTGSNPLEHAHHSPYPKWTEWLFTTDAKKIGIVYMMMSFVYFFVGGICAGGIRIQLATPDMNFVDGDRKSVV